MNKRFSILSFTVLAALTPACLAAPEDEEGDAMVQEAEATPYDDDDIVVTAHPAPRRRLMDLRAGDGPIPPLPPITGVPRPRPPLPDDIEAFELDMDATSCPVEPDIVPVRAPGAPEDDSEDPEE